MEEILLNKLGKRVILLGNEAIVRGALESGVNFVSTYPGTPASEIGNTFFKIARKAGVYFEFSTNEKVAMEAGIGASFSGLKTLVAMKNFGLNVALDSLIPFVYTGTKGPTVIVVADDPSCHSSAQSEENSRGMAGLVHLPILEPSDPQECRDFVKLGFQISEKFKIPVMIRTTTRVAHQKMPVRMGNFKKISSRKGKFVKNPKQFITLPPRVLEMKKELLDKVKKIRKFSEKSKINRIEGRKSKIGIIASGISYLYVKEALRELKLDLPVFKLGFFYPLPKEKLKKFLKGLNKVLVVEELEGWMEEVIFLLAKMANPKVKIFGKNLLPEVGELKPEIVASAIARFVNKKYSLPRVKYDLKVPKRLPQLCPGCPYWLVISAIKKAVDVKKVIFGGEIGCYMLFGNSPINLQDYLSCMGSSVGIAHGIKKASGQKLIAFVGDSSFFHAGIPPLINTVFNKSNPLIIILENQTTAMTGHQPHPGAPVAPDGIKIEKVVRGCGVKNLKVIDSANQKELVATIKEFLKKKEVSVIIARHPCIFVK
jgi:indolepyruvate ferredoxin oxidoreductase alpha subunit